MAVDFHQTGDHSGTLQVDGIGGNILGQDSAELAVDYLKGTGMELKIGTENTGVCIEHKEILLSNLL